MTIALRYTVRSDVGLLRDGNEDSAYAGPHLLAIADGMGGHAAGEVASAVAIKTLAPLDAAIECDDMLSALSTAIADANSSLRRIAEEDPATEGMGTTLTALLWSGDEVALCHIGDSRAYLLRDGTLQQITHDHTLVQSLVDEGRLTPEAAAAHPQRSLVMRALQSSIPADPDLAMLRAQIGDRYLLCSDGLTDVVSDETLQMTLQQLTDLDAAVDQLVDLAIRSGGPDNITCVLADVIDTDGEQAPTEQIIIVGALATDDPEGSDCTEPARSDNPAARARLLAQSAQQTESEPDPPANVASAPAGEAEDTTGPGRRRWPVVTCLLVLLVGVVGAAGYYGWRLAQNQYYVGTSQGRVVVFRGLSQAIAGVRLSSVVQRTNIPLSALPSSEAGSIKSTIGPEANLKQAQRIISQFQHDYRCAVAAADITKWVAHRPKQALPPHKHKTSRTRRTHRKTSSQSTSKSAPKPGRAAADQTANSTNATSQHSAKPASGHTVTSHSAASHANYPPKPVMPKFCPAYQGTSG